MVLLKAMENANMLLLVQKSYDCHREKYGGACDNYNTGNGRFSVERVQNFTEYMLAYVYYITSCVIPPTPPAVDPL